jgi:hypothetical protein
MSNSSYIAKLDAEIADLLAAWPTDDEDDEDDDLWLPPRRSATRIEDRENDDASDIHGGDTGGGDIHPSDVYNPPDGYRRDRLGRWRYNDGGYVPGASDVTLGHLYRFVTDKNTCYIPTVHARNEPSLAWARRYPLTTSGSLVCHNVPVSTWTTAQRYVVSLSAPELCADQLIDTRKLAELLGVRPASVAAYLHRGRLPQPVARIANSPVWARPVLARWIANRGRRH